MKQDGKELYTGEPKDKRVTRVVLGPESVEVLREHGARHSLTISVPEAHSCSGR